MHTRKFDFSKMNEICDKYNLHVIVLDLEVTNKNSLVRVNNKNFFSEAAIAPSMSPVSMRHCDIS